jgi:hypothetical protein
MRRQETLSKKRKDRKYSITKILMKEVSCHRPSIWKDLILTLMMSGALSIEIQRLEMKSLETKRMIRVS